MLNTSLVGLPAHAATVAKAASRVDAQIAVLIAKGWAPAGAPAGEPGKKPDEMAKADPPWADLMVVLTAIAENTGKIAGCMAEDGVEMAKRAAAKAALAKAAGGGPDLAAIEKAVKEVALRVSKIEKAELPPNGSGPSGRGTVAKSEPEWPADMAAK
mgnify:CR=1 FL=1